MHIDEKSQKEKIEKKRQNWCATYVASHTVHTFYFILFLSISSAPMRFSTTAKFVPRHRYELSVWCGKCVQRTARGHEVRCRKFKSLWIYCICMTRVRWRKYAWMIKNSLLATATGNCRILWKLFCTRALGLHTFSNGWRLWKLYLRTAMWQQISTLRISILHSSDSDHRRWPFPFFLGLFAPLHFGIHN